MSGKKTTNIDFDQKQKANLQAENNPDIRTNLQTFTDEQVRRKNYSGMSVEQMRAKLASYSENDLNLKGMKKVLDQNNIPYHKNA